MNQNNVFGSSQGGAFQAPTNPNPNTPAGLFQAFGQQQNTVQSQPQPHPMNLFQTPMFGQPSAGLNQAPSTMFGQTPAFGQPSVFGQSSGQPAPMSQAPSFGQPGVGQGVSGFGTGSTPAFGQTSGPGQAWFGQTPAFGQSSTFGQTPGFVQQQQQQQQQLQQQLLQQQQQQQQRPPHFGLPSATAPTNTLVSTQPTGFGQSTFGQPSTTVTASTFSKVQNLTQQGKGFGTTDFSFKPATEVLFKPIYSASPEPTNPQATATGPTQTFGAMISQTAPSTMESSSAALIPTPTAPVTATATAPTTAFSILTGAKNATPGFSFSQPTTAPSISVHKDPMTIDTSGSSNSGGLKFTFSQPAAPSSTTSATTTSTTTAQPTTPSSFSFSAKVVQPQTAPIFGGAGGFSQTSAFGDPKAKPDAGADERGGEQSTSLETNVFARLGKATKRKEDQSSSSSEKPLKEEQTSSSVVADTATRPPPKRALLRSRGPPAGLFGRAMSGLGTKYQSGTSRREKSQQQVPDWPEGENEDSPGPVAPQVTTPPRSQAPIREVLEKAGDSDSAKTPESESEQAKPARRTLRSESSESGSGAASPMDCIALQCKAVPLALNKKEVLEKHFARFGQVRRVLCRPAKSLAIIHFQDHAAAAKAKKRGKMLHRHELHLFWQRKKQSPGEAEREAEKKDLPAVVTPGSSPRQRPQFRAAVAGGSASLSRSSPVKKPSIAKSLQFDTEPSQEGTSDSQSQSSERPVPSSLLHLIGQTAETAEEKYRLLEQRDKIMRQGRPKCTDLVLSKAFVGTCPDMCPEKERYMRDTRKQLSCFELVPDTEMVDHGAAIKEYSRSSADQEVPLPHELRPLPVLSMTMDYLVTQVMDQAQDNFRDWYDFVWNRTRGIRKDIIQQHLCCPQTVALIEKCTCFHVHCAHHLCEESMMTFDAKINNENMTKCLRSLKEMYEDLATCQVYCPREAEFRLYNVLLKLDDGAILREVEQFRDEVRNSPEVKFAVQVFSALSSNNFVRFFKLVKCASYLASCLLHRYFNQVRAKALLTLTIAHTVGSQRSTLFPVEDLARMLMFPDTGAASHFVQQYGLMVNDGMVELSRTAYQEPEVSLSLKRSGFILAKRSVLVGEVVNGGPLPSPPQHSPVCSFDSHNRYRGEGAPTTEPSTSQSRASSTAASSVAMATAAGTTVFPSPPKFLQEPWALPEAQAQPQVQHDRLFADLQQLPPGPLHVSATTTTSTGEPTGEASIASLSPSGVALLAGPAQPLFQPLFPPQPAKAPSPLLPVAQPTAPTPPAYTDEDLVPVVEAMVEEEMELAVREVANEGVAYAQLALVESGVQVEALLTEVIGQVLQEVSSSEIQLEASRVAEEKRRMEEARRRQECEAFLVQFSFSLCAEILTEVLAESILQTSREQIHEAERDQRELVARCTEQVCAGLVEETLAAEIGLLAEEVLEAELQHIHKYIKRWRDVVAVRRQLKRQMRGFPAAPCGVDPRCRLRALVPSASLLPSLSRLARGLVSLGNAGDMALSSTRLLRFRQQTLHQMRVHYYYQRLLDEAVWAPLDLPALVLDSIPDPTERIFFKAALLLPSNHESVASLADQVLSDWLEVKLGGGEGSEVSKEKLADGTLQTLCLTETLQEVGEQAHMVHLSVKVSRGPLSDEGFSQMEESAELQGTGALLLLLPALPDPVAGQDDQDVPLLSALLQLKQLQQAGAWHQPLPLVVLVPGAHCHSTSDLRQLEEALMLPTLVEEGLISEHTFYHIPESTSDLQASQQLTQAIRWLLDRAPKPRPLSCQTLVQFVEAGVGRHFLGRLQAQRQERSSAGLPSLAPGPVVCLYNAVLAHLADALSSPELQALSWPPGEFSRPDTRYKVPHLGWNSTEHLAWLRSTVLGLRLPSWGMPSATAGWSQLHSSILRYASQIPGMSHGRLILMSHLENLLERVRRQHAHRGHRHCLSEPCRMSWGRSRDDNQGPGYDLVPWDDLLVLCINQKLQDWPNPGPPVCQDAVTEAGEVLVYFLPDALERFEPPEEWNQAVALTHQEKRQHAEGGPRAADGAPSSLSLRPRLFHSLAGPPLVLSSSSVLGSSPSLDITCTPMAQELLAGRLLRHLEEEKALGQRSIEELKHWLNSDPPESLSMPLFIPSSTLLCAPTAEAPLSMARPPRSPLKKKANTCYYDDAAAAAADVWTVQAELDRIAPPTPPLAQRLQDIQRQILASQEEELCCRLKLDAMLGIVDD